MSGEVGEVIVPVKKLGYGGVIAGVVVVLIEAGLGGLIHHYGTHSSERAAAGDWGSVAFALVVATPAALALLGLQRRPWLLVAAGVVLFPMCFLSFSFLFFPLLLPAVFFLTDAITRPRRTPQPPAQCVAAALSALFVVAAVLSLWAHQDPVTWSTATGSGSASDVITLREAWTSFGFLAAAIAVAAFAPRDGQTTSL
jgi:hypothetical protein